MCLTIHTANVLWFAAVCAAAIGAPEPNADPGTPGGVQSDAADPEGAGRTLASPLSGIRGIHFNPQLRPDIEHYPWLLFYPDCREEIREALDALVRKAHVNLVGIFVSIPYTLLHDAQGPLAGQAIDEWANMAYFDNVAAFVDDCDEAGLSVQIDLATNAWIPYAVDTANHLANAGRWPKPDDTPWDEAATWYSQVIEAIEGRTRHPERIAMWCMMGNYQHGASEPCLWEREDLPPVEQFTERFVKHVWPVFVASGTRPKAAPILLPIFSKAPYWMARSPEQRLSAFTNLRKWLVDDLAMPPDYWVMTTYPFCDPGPDGFYYLREIVRVLGPDSASRLISTDLKWHDWDGNGVHTCIIPTQGRSATEMLDWQFRKAAEYGMAGWWIWSYQDTANDSFGIRTHLGEWKPELVEALARQAPAK